MDKEDDNEEDTDGQQHDNFIYFDKVDHLSLSISCEIKDLFGAGVRTRKKSGFGCQTGFYTRIRSTSENPKNPKSTSKSTSENPKKIRNPHPKIRKIRNPHPNRHPKIRKIRS